MFTKYNQWLLKNYPTLWNYKVIPYLLYSLGFNLLNFIFGNFCARDYSNLQNSYYSFDTLYGILSLFNGILSIILIVIWITQMVKNNAFKNYYPMTHWKLFGQFLMIFVMFLSTISFTYSFYFGFNQHIATKFSNEKLLEIKDTVDLGVAFLGGSTDNYTLNNRTYPEVFSKSECFVNPEQIDRSQKYYTFLDGVYQYRELKEMTDEEIKQYIDTNNQLSEVYDDYEASLPIENEVHTVYNSRKNKQDYFKFGKVLDLDAYISTTAPSYRNFSVETIHIYDSSYDKYRSYYEKDDNNDYEVNKKINELLDRNNPEEIKQLLTDFIEISRDFQISNNLDADSWFKMVYHPEKNFEVQEFITNEYPKDDNSYTIDYATVETAPTQWYRYEQSHKSKDYYYNLGKLNTMIQNIEYAKDDNILSSFGIVLLYIALGLSTLLFTNRVLNLRAILLGTVTAGVLVIISIIFGVFSGSPVVGFGFTLSLLLILFISPILSNIEASKKSFSIIIAIVINTFPLLILNIIGLHDMTVSLDRYDENYDANTWLFFKDLDPLVLSLSIIIISIILMRLYIPVLFKWQRAKE